MSDIKPIPTTERNIVAAIEQKLVRDSVNRRTRGISSDAYAMTNVSNELATAALDAKRIRQLTPHITLIEKAIVGTTLTSGVGETDRVEGVIITTPEWSAGSTISSVCVEKIKQHLTNDYKITDNLNELLTRCLFIEGSAPVMVLPEAAIDKMILDATRGNATPNMESYERNKSSLGFINVDTTFDSVNMESSSGSATDKKAKTKMKYSDIRKKLNYSISDAVTDFIIPAAAARQKINQECDITARFMYNSESQGAFIEKHYKEVTKREVFKSIPYIKHASEDGGQPIVMFLPARAVIAVTSPQDRRDHKGYIVLIGENGYPVNDLNEYSTDIFNTMSKSSKEQASQMIQSAYTAMYGVDGRQGATRETSEQLEAIYRTIVSEDIANILTNSNIEGTVTDLTEISRIMFAQLLRNQMTRLVYVPKQFMTYFAYDYDELGHGISLSERNKLLSIMYINLMLAKYISDFNNAINQQKLSIEVDESDMDYENTVSTIRENFFNMRTGATQYFSSSPLDSITQLQRAGVTTVVSGGNTPNTKVDVEIVEGQRKTIDDGLLENIRRLHIMGYGAIPELVDSSFGVDYAAVQWLNNDMFVRIVSEYKLTTNMHLTDHIRKYCKFNHTLCRELLEAIKSNIDSVSDSFYAEHDIEKAINPDELAAMILLDFIAHITIELPKIQRGTDDATVEVINKYSDLLDALLDKCFSDESMTPAVLGNLADHNFDPAEFKARLKAIKMREFCIAKGIEPELVGLTPPADSEGSAMAVITQLMIDEEDKMRSVIMEFWKESTDVIGKSNKDIEKLASKLEAKYGDNYDATLGSGEDASFSTDSGGEGEADVDDEFTEDFGGDTGEPSEPEEPMLDEEEPKEPQEPEEEEPKEPEA